jgi:hypothetical protein
MTTETASGEGVGAATTATELVTGATSPGGEREVAREGSGSGCCRDTSMVH